MMFFEKVKMYYVMLDKELNILECCENSKKIIETTNFKSAIHSKDKKLFLSILLSLEEKVVTDIQKFSFNLIDKNNQVIPVFALINYVDDHYIVHMIDEKSFNEAILHETNIKKFDEIIYSLYQDLSFVYDIIDRKFIRLSKNHEDILDEKTLSVLEISKNLIHKDDVSIFEDFINSLNRGKKYTDFEIRILDGGTYHNCKIMSKTIFENGIPRYSVGIIKSEENTNLIKRLEENLILDPATGVLNKVAIKKYAMDVIKDRIETNNDKMVAILIIDIDNFKFVNDSFGHAFGDSIIIECANILKNKVRSIGNVGRFGGDEFMVVIDKCENASELPNICKSICYGFENIRKENIESFNNSCTIGVSQYPKDANDFDSLFLMADKTLYRGKKKGKNCYVIYDREKHGGIEGNKALISYDLEYTNNISYENFIVNTLIDLNNKKNIYRTILSVLNRYAIDQARVLLLDSEGYKVTHKILIDGSKKTYSKKIHSEHCMKNLLALYENDDMMCYSRALDIEDHYKKIYDDVFKSNDVRAVLSFKKEINIAKAIVINFEMTSKKRLWSKEEISVIHIISKYLLDFIKSNNYQK